MRLIDSDALMEELKTPVLIDNEKASRIWEGWHECTIAVKEAIDRTPTVEERKTGMWIRMSDADGEFYACSECGNWNGKPTNFCSECGSYNGGKQP